MTNDHSRPLMRTFLLAGAVNALLAVALGAFGAHGLKDRLDEEMLDVYKTGVQYHMYHALGLLAVALVADKLRSVAAVKWTGRLLLAGIVLFSGSLYVLALTDVEWLGAITPFGGVAFLAGWATLAVAAYKQR